jgi:hypothetical protein
MLVVEIANRRPRVLVFRRYGPSNLEFAYQHCNELIQYTVSVRKSLGSPNPKHDKRIGHFRLHKLLFCYFSPHVNKPWRIKFCFSTVVQIGLNIVLCEEYNTSIAYFLSLFLLLFSNSPYIYTLSTTVSVP